MINPVKYVVAKSVFRSMKGYSMSDVFAALFHRMAATLYLIYTVWAILIMIGGTPILVQQQGDQWTFIFAVFVLVTAAPACFGATFFPRAAQVELYAGFAFFLLILVYYYFIIQSIVYEGGSIARFMLVTSVAVMPLTRTLIVAWFLVTQAKLRKAEEDV